MSDPGPVKRQGRLVKPPWMYDEPKRRTNRELEEYILTILGIDAMRNPDTNSRGSITPLQISKQVPDLILRSFEDIQNTLNNMKEKGLLHVMEQTYSTATPQAQEEETAFQITINGIIRYRKSIRRIGILAINDEEKYQTILDETEGDPEVKAELKELPEKIKHGLAGDLILKLKTGVKNVPKIIVKRIENKTYEKIAEVVVHYGIVRAGTYIISLVFSGNGG